MISIVATETSTVTFLSVPGDRLPGRLHVPPARLRLHPRPGRRRGRPPARRTSRARSSPPTRSSRRGSAARRRRRPRSSSSSPGPSARPPALPRRQGAPADHRAGPIAGLDRRRSASSTIVYTFLGGMKAVIWTDVIQFFIYILGAVVRPGDPRWARSPAAGPTIWQQGQAAGKFRVIDLGGDSPSTGWLDRLEAILSKPYTFWAGLIGGMVLNTGDPRGRPDDGPALPLGPLATPGGLGPDRQRVRDPRPVRPVPVHRRRPLGLLPTAPADRLQGPTSSPTFIIRLPARPACSGW